MSYIVEKGKIGFNIREKQTGTLIELEQDENQIRTTCRKMNLGSGFNGWTPGFFAVSVKKKIKEA
jgi:hypothetical protein